MARNPLNYSAVVDTRQVMRVLEGIDTAIAKQIVGDSLYQFCEEEVATRSRVKYVPVMDGNLRASIITDPDPKIVGTRITVTVGAGGAAAPYAARVHENPRSGRTGGIGPSGQKYKKWAQVGQWKYLEVPMIEAANNIPKLVDFVRARLAEVVNGAR